MNSMILIAVSCFLVLACSKSSDKKTEPAPAAQNEFLSSYEAVDGCSTGRQVFKANSEEDIAKAVCASLSDENLNNGCASSMRADLFRTISCRGVFPVKLGAESGFSSTFSKSYAYQEDGCSTGIHFFYASSESKTKELLCKALSDDSFNRNCAKAKREDALRKNECVVAAVSVPDAKPDAKPEPQPETKKDETLNTPFSCYHEKNICDEKTEYCLISKDPYGNRNTDECLKLPSECKDDDCLVKSAKLRFCQNGDPNHCTDNCKGDVQISRKNNRVTVNCTGLPLKKHY